MTWSHASQPRICGHQGGRDNVPSNTPVEYFRRAISVSFLDEILTQFDKRYGPLQRKVSEGMFLLPKLLLDNQDQAKEHIMRYAAEFEDNLPGGCSR